MLKGRQVLIGSRLFGFLLLVTATVIQIAVIPPMDSQINELNDKINKSYMREQKSLQMLADIRMIQLYESLYLFQSNMYLALDTKDKILRVKALRQKALDKAIDAARAVDAILHGGKGKQLEKQTEKEINEIFNDNNLSIDEKIKRVSRIFYKNLSEGNQRLNTLYTDRNEIKEKMNREKNIRYSYNKWFLVFQILGLGLFSLPEVIEKIIIRQGVSGNENLSNDSKNKNT